MRPNELREFSEWLAKTFTAEQIAAEKQRQIERYAALRRRFFDEVAHAFDAAIMLRDDTE
jgi:hypothetical protein